MSDDPFMDLVEADMPHIWRADPWSLRLLAAVRLCPTLTIARAFLDGEPVPRSSLDPQWLEAYGL